MSFLSGERHLPSYRLHPLERCLSEITRPIFSLSMRSLLGEYLRTHFKVKPAPCWACRIGHCHMMEVTEGPYKGFVGEEPEYEALAAMGPVIGQPDPGAAVMLANLVDRLGMDVNETRLGDRLAYGVL